MRGKQTTTLKPTDLYAKNIDQKMLSVMYKLKDNNYDFSDGENMIIKNFYDKEEHDNNSVKYKFKRGMYLDKLNKSGIFALVSNNFTDPNDTLKWYRLRENIEDFFCMLKIMQMGKELEFGMTKH